GFTSKYFYTTPLGELDHEVLPNTGTQSVQETLTPNGTTGTEQFTTFKTALANVGTGTQKNPTTHKTSITVDTSGGADRMTKVTTAPDQSRRRVSQGADHS